MEAKQRIKQLIEENINFINNYKISFLGNTKFSIFVTEETLEKGLSLD